MLQTKNTRLEQKPKTQVAAALHALQARAGQLKINHWVRVEAQSQNRLLALTVDTAALDEARKLDGCYVIKTDLLVDWATTHVVHDRYKDLALVEQNFRTCKTVELEMRPVHVRLEASTRGHALVVMLAHRLIQELQGCWAQENLTVEEGIKELSTFCVTEVVVHGAVKDQVLPEPRTQVKKLIELAKVVLPKRLRYIGRIVSTKKHLKKSRTPRCK